VTKLTLGVAAGLPIIAALLVRQQTTLALGLVSISLLYIGYATRLKFATYASCASTYFPLSLLLGLFIPQTYSYLISATVLTVIGERLSLEYSLRGALMASRAVDREAYNRAMELSRKHTRLLGVVVVAVTVSALASYFISRFRPDALIVLASAIGLLASLRLLVERGPNRVSTDQTQADQHT